VHVEFKEAGAAGREALHVSALRRCEEDARGSRRISGATQVFSGALPRARSLLKPFIPCVLPASGQTNPLTSRTCLPAAQDQACGPAHIKESDLGAATFRRVPSHGHTWGSGQSSWPVSRR
jgi:hypothetical protein